MVNHIGGQYHQREQLEDMCISASAQQNNMFLLYGTMLQLKEVRNKVVNCGCSNIGPYHN